MRQISFLIGVILVLSGCTRYSYDYTVENTLLDCFYKHHEDINIDVKSSIDKIEHVLLKHNILYDESGESYIKIIQHIKNNTHFDINNQELLADINSIGYIPSSVFCSDTSYLSLIDSTSVAESKLKYIIGIFDTIRVKGSVSAPLIAEQVLKVFNAKDFENNYYKTIGLLILSNEIKNNAARNGILGVMNKPENQPTKN